MTVGASAAEINEPMIGRCYMHRCDHYGNLFVKPAHTLHWLHCPYHETVMVSDIIFCHILYWHLCFFGIFSSSLCQSCSAVAGRLLSILPVMYAVTILSDTSAE